MDHFRIPKLELMQSVAPSIPQIGFLLQWSVDTTEHAHIEVVKDPASMTNHHDYDAQICCALDHNEKCRLFVTAIRLQTSQNHDLNDLDDITRLDGSEELEGDHDIGDAPQGHILGDLWSAKHQSTNFFEVAANVASKSTIGNSLPPRTIVALAGLVAIHLNIEPMHHRPSIDKVAEEFELPDLRGVLADYVRCEGQPHQRKFHTFGGPRRSAPDVELPFSELQIWHKVCLQQRSYHCLTELGPMFTVNAHPPNQTWKHGQYDATILQVDQAHQWPLSGLTGTLSLHRTSCFNSGLLRTLRRSCLPHHMSRNSKTWLYPLGKSCSHICTKA